jgi:small neutral amino acid transporter SnatA (MarC family)
MNRAFLIILMPAVLVALGYIVLFRFLGVSAGYGRLAGAMIVFFCGIWWLGRPGRKKASSRSDVALT